MTHPDDLLPIGLADALPAEAAAISRVMRALLDAFAAQGYARVRPPLVEFEHALAQRMDGVSSTRMIRFTDPASLRTLAVRIDMTPQVGRIAATALAGEPRPLRLCYAGEVATIIAGQLDPARQRMQIGAELVGNDGVAAAREAVELALEALEAAGVTGISVDFTLPDLVDTLAVGALPLPKAQVDAVRRQLDMKDAGGLREAGGEAYLDLLYAAGPVEEAIAKLSNSPAGPALASRLEAVREIAAGIGNRATVTLDPTERHGFEYQSWLGFTFYGAGARGLLGRGGTYMIHGSEEPAVGFSLFMEPLLEALGTEGDAQDRLFLPLEHDREAARRLRALGWTTLAAVAADDDAAKLGCTHRLAGNEPQQL